MHWFGTRNDHRLYFEPDDMLSCDTLIRNAMVVDGSVAAPELSDVAIRDGSIRAIGPSLELGASRVVDAEGLALAPGFIDVHTHDDTSVIRTSRQKYANPDWSSGNNWAELPVW